MAGSGASGSDFVGDKSTVATEVFKMMMPMLTEIKEMCADRNIKIGNLESEKSDLQKELDQKTKRVQELEAELQQQKEGFGARDKEVEKDKLESEIIELREKLKCVEDQLKEEQERCKELDKKNKEQQPEQNTVDGSTLIKPQLQLIGSRWDVLIAQKDGIMMNIQQTKYELEETNNKRAILMKRKPSSEKEARQNKITIDKLQNEIGRLNALLIEKNKQLHATEIELENVKTKQDSSKVDQLKKEIEQHKESLNKTKEEKEEVKTEIKDLKKQLKQK